MPDKECISLSKKIHYGLALAEKKMLEDKAVKDETLIEGTPSGEIKEVAAKDVLHKIKRQSYRSN